MEIMIDTNIIISAAIFPNSSVALLLKAIAEKHELYICTFTLKELNVVVERKFNDKKALLDTFLINFPYELIYTPTVINHAQLPYIRDIDDYPVLLSAINADVDVLLSGDKDFAAVECKRPEVMTPQEFREKYL
jgi:putative PIN family toxin of toxin-antitoxin system